MRENNNREVNMDYNYFDDGQIISMRNLQKKNKKKKYVIKSHKRFITFLTILLLLISGTIYGITKSDIAIASVGDDYTNYTVTAGDTLWEIADKTMSNDSDIRKNIFAIEKANQIEGGYIYPGMELKIPVK